MKIGIDARLMHETGVGRYIRNLMSELSKIDDTNTYVVFVTQSGDANFILPNKRWQKVVTNVGWHTIAEQFVMPMLYIKEKLDLVHVPYFNIPIFYTGSMVVTIHDLTILHFDTGKASTRFIVAYKLKRFFYGVVMAAGVKKAKHIITPSQATKKEIVDHYRVPEEKITVTYEGVDEGIYKNSGTRAPLIPLPYFLCVGNAYPHKNLDLVINALSNAKDDVHVVFVGKEDFFYRRLQSLANTKELSTHVTFYGSANDALLQSLYIHAQALIFPSLMEGFGLPPLEAIRCGCPVIASDIPVHKEILKNMATYIDPHDPKALSTLISTWKRADHEKDDSHITSFLKAYDWRHMAKETLDTYESCTRL